MLFEKFDGAHTNDGRQRYTEFGQEFCADKLDVDDEGVVFDHLFTNDVLNLSRRTEHRNISKRLTTKIYKPIKIIEISNSEKIKKLKSKMNNRKKTQKYTQKIVDLFGIQCMFYVKYVAVVDGIDGVVLVHQISTHLNKRHQISGQT